MPLSIGELVCRSLEVYGNTLALLRRFLIANSSAPLPGAVASTCLAALMAPDGTTGLLSNSKRYVALTEAFLMKMANHQEFNRLI